MAISKSLRFRILNRDNFTCSYCGRRAPDVRLEVDHVHPRSKGGSDHPSNLKTACFDCNRGKGKHSLSQEAKEFTGDALAAIASMFDELEDAMSAFDDASHLLRG